MIASNEGQSQTLGATRGVGAVDVALAADALLRDGLRPTIERIREKLGRGSPNTINPLLDQWWKGLAARLSGGPEMLERIPASAFHVLEALWVQLQIAARDRAAVALAGERGETNRNAQNLEVRSQVLSLREGELNERLRRQEDRLRALEDQLLAVSGQLKRAELDGSAARTRAKNLDAELADARARITALLTRVVIRERSNPLKRNAPSPKAKRRKPRNSRAIAARKVPNRRRRNR